MVNEESDGFAGLAENVVALQGSVQELTGPGRSTQSMESLHEVTAEMTPARPTVFKTPKFSAIRKNPQQELSVADSATSSAQIAHQDGVGN